MSNPLSPDSPIKFTSAIPASGAVPLRWSLEEEKPPIAPLLPPVVPTNLCGPTDHSNNNETNENKKENENEENNENKKNENKERRHTVHLVAHSHMDFGWQAAYRVLWRTKAVPIFQAVLEWTHRCPAARFVLADGGMFHLLWPHLHHADRDRWRHVVAQAKVEFLGGLPVAMSDLAGSGVEMLLAAYREGGRFLRRERLGGRPRETVGGQLSLLGQQEFYTWCLGFETAWYIDPFGTSKTMMRLVGELGMKNLFIMRVDDATKQILKRENKLNFKWRDSVSNKTVNIFILPEGYAMDPNLEFYYKRNTSLRLYNQFNQKEFLARATGKH